MCLLIHTRNAGVGFAAKQGRIDHTLNPEPLNPKPLEKWVLPRALAAAPRAVKAASFLRAAWVGTGI